MTASLGERASVAATLRSAIARLRAARLASPELDARILLAHAAGLETSDLLARSRDPLPAAALARLDGYVSRRLAGESPARIRGHREFWGLDFRLSQDTLEPRPDSEALVEAVLDGVTGEMGRAAPLRLADLGTGSGCLLIALLSELPNASGIGVDISFGAAETARRNAVQNHVGGRAAFAVGSWAQSLSPGHDVILSNPPYIPGDEIEGLSREVANHDPRLALDGGPDGLDAYRALIPSARRALRPKGLIALEIGAGQGAAVAALLHSEGFEIRAMRRDLAGIERAVLAARRA